MGVTAPSTAAEKQQGGSEPGAGGAARGPRVPVRKPRENKAKKKKRGWYKIVRQSRPVRRAWLNQDGRLMLLPMSDRGGACA